MCVLLEFLKTPRVPKSCIISPKQQCPHMHLTDSNNFAHFSLTIPKTSGLAEKCNGHLLRFLGVSAELRRATTSFAMFVRLSVRMVQFRSHWTDFDKT